MIFWLNLVVEFKSFPEEFARRYFFHHQISKFLRVTGSLKNLFWRHYRRINFKNIWPSINENILPLPNDVVLQFCPKRPEIVQSSTSSINFSTLSINKTIFYSLRKRNAVKRIINCRKGVSNLFHTHLQI